MATFGRVNPFVDRLLFIGDKLALSDKQFEAVSIEAENELKNKPSLYSFKVVVLALVGYAFIALVLLSVVVALWFSWQLLAHHRGGYSLQIAIPLCLLLFALLKSLFVRMPKPDGIVIERNDAPRLFAMIDELCSELNTNVDHVLLSDEMNAYVCQYPLLGIGGLYQNYMVLGVPLMLHQDTDQFKAILAHELGHLSGNHSRSSAWIYNLRARWSNLLSSTENEAFFAIFFLFTSWFSPRFNAYSLALARAHEIDADADAARVTSARTYSLSLLRLKRDDSALDEHFWDDIYDLSKRAAKSPTDVFKQLKVHACTYQPSKSDLQLHLKQVFDDTSAGFSTHPSVKKRLLQGKFEPAILIDEQNQLEDDVLEQLLLPIDSEKSAAATYLGEHLNQALTVLSERWAASIEAAWTERHSSFSEWYKRLAELDEKEKLGELTLEELGEKANLVARTESAEVSLPVQVALLARDPDNPTVQFNVGNLLLRAGDEDGLSLLRQSINNSFSLAGDACPIIISYLKKQDRLEEIPAFKALLKRYEDETDKAKKERVGINAKADLDPHELTQQQIDYLANELQRFKPVTHLYVVRKRMQYFPELPFLVLGVELNTYSDADEANLALWLLANIDLPHEFCVTTFNLGSNALKEKIIATENSVVYRRHREK